MYLFMAVYMQRIIKSNPNPSTPFSQSKTPKNHLGICKCHATTDETREKRCQHMAISTSPTASQPHPMTSDRSYPVGFKAGFGLCW